MALVYHAKMKVFIIEDDEDVSLVLQALLEQLGHEVQCARYGIEGVSMLLNTQPDVAFIDIGLPDIDGIEVVRRIRAVPRGNHIGLIAYTGYDTAALRLQAFDAGFDYYQTKPARKSTLSDIIETYASCKRM